MHRSRFDAAAIAEIWGHNTDRAYRTVLVVFAAEAKQLGQAIDTAMTLSDMPALHYAAHTLKGAAGNVGARQLSAHAATLAEQAAEGRVERANLQLLRRELRAVLGEISEAP